MQEKSIQGETTEQEHPLIFALDTASSFTSMAVARGASLLGVFGASLDSKRSERLWTEAAFLLGELELALSDVELFAVSVGPGGFTGLRIGIAAVKGFAAATSKPVVGVSSLEAVAAASGAAGLVLAMINAYKGEVYSQLFSLDSSGVPVAHSAPAVTRSYEAVERVAGIETLAFAGDGAAASVEIIREVGGEKYSERSQQQASDKLWRVIPPRQLYADQISRLAFFKYIKGEALSAEALQACYVRPSDAEIKLSLGLLGGRTK